MRRNTRSRWCPGRRLRPHFSVRARMLGAVLSRCMSAGTGMDGMMGGMTTITLQKIDTPIILTAFFRSSGASLEWAAAMRSEFDSQHPTRGVPSGGRRLERPVIRLSFPARARPDDRAINWSETRGGGAALTGSKERFHCPLI